MSVEKKINMFNIKSVNTEFMITIYDDYTIFSGSYKKKLYNVQSITYPSYSDSEAEFNKYLINKIHKKLLGNTIEKNGNIENHEYIKQDKDGNIICKFIFETESYIIEKNSINSIIKIIDNKKLVITVFDDNIFVTKIKDNILDTPITFDFQLVNNSYFENASCVENYNLQSRTSYYPPSQDDFTQTQKQVFAKHCSYVRKVLRLNYEHLKINDEPLKTNDNSCIY